MRKIKAVSLMVIAALLLGGCVKKDPDTITVDISVLGSACISLDGVRAAYSRWQEDNPGHSIIERESVGSNDLVSLAVMGADHLPDVFVTDSRTGRLLAEAGLVVDLTGLAPDVDTFTYGGEVFAYPVSVESASVIVYDPNLWEEGSMVGYDSQNPYSFADCYLSSLIIDDVGQDWLNHMVVADGQASFTDGVFVDRMDSALDLFNEDIPYESVTELIDAFVSGECPAVFVTGSNVRLLLKTVRTENSELYERIEFASLTNEGLPYGYPYGVFIRSGLEDDTLAECVHLASEIASFEMVAEDDDTTERFNEFVGRSDHSRILSQYFIYDFWYLAYEKNFDRFSAGDITAEEYASILQNFYEMYYIKLRIL